MSDETAYEDHQEALRAWVEPTLKSFPKDRKHAVSEACYSFSERNMLGDFQISEQDALMVWAIVERCRQEGFPTTLRM